MKTTFEDSEYGINITLVPETVEETSSLLRFGLNASAEKPTIYVSFRKTFYCDIYLKKRKSTVQKYSINPNLK